MHPEIGTYESRDQNLCTQRTELLKPEFGTCSSRDQNLCTQKSEIMHPEIGTNELRDWNLCIQRSELVCGISLILILISYVGTLDLMINSQSLSQSNPAGFDMIKKELSSLRCNGLTLLSLNC